MFRSTVSVSRLGGIAGSKVPIESVRIAMTRLSPFRTLTGYTLSLLSAAGPHPSTTVDCASMFCRT
ncbi:MAG TPA: hypothetical protein VK587_12040 [bacterium]|nr:hypothetical protein [bacterium]